MTTITCVHVHSALFNVNVHNASITCAMNDNLQFLAMRICEH